MKVGLVFAGGGGRGAYEIGAWKALKKLGIDKHVVAVSGTSIGALNAALFIQGDLDVAEDVWNNISVQKILPMDSLEFFFKARMLSLGIRTLTFVKKHVPKLLEQGKLSRDGVLEILNKHIYIEKIQESKIPCYVCCTEVPCLKSKYFNIQDYNEETIKSILLASSAIPSIFECEELETRKYLDGGLMDNVPVQPVYGAGCNIIFIIHLSKNERVDRRMFPNAKIIEIVPTEIDESVVDGTLNFANEAIRKRIQQGYDDTLNLLLPILEIARYQIEEAQKEDTLMNSLNDLMKNLYSRIKQNKIFNEDDKRE